MKVELSKEEVDTILECVRKGRDLNDDIVNHTDGGNGAAHEHNKAVDKLRRCLDVLKALEHEDGG